MPDADPSSDHANASPVGARAQAAAGADAADATEAVAAALPAIDIAAMMRSLDNDAELAQQLARLFVDNSQRLLARMRQAFAAGDTAELGRAAHEMRGAVGNFHAASAVAAAAALEGSAQAGDLARATGDFARVEGEMDRVFPLLEALSNGGAASPG